MIEPTPLDTIRAALAAAGSAGGGNAWYSEESIAQVLENAPAPLPGDMRIPDAHLIAAAPAWLAELADRVEAAEAEREAAMPPESLQDRIEADQRMWLMGFEAGKADQIESEAGKQ